jgi:all-trans-retinol 13,14-reductase
MGMELLSTLRSLTKDERLIQVLAGNNLLYAGVAGQTPFYTHAMSTEAYLHSAHKVVPGSSQIAKLLWKELQRHGGEIHRHAAVTALHEEGGTIRYAATADGARWEAANYIAAIHPAVLFSMMDSKALRPAFRQRVGSLPHTPPAVMVNLVLKPAAVAYPGHNIYWHPSGEALGRLSPAGIQWPDTQALFYTEDAANPGFAESLSILAYADEGDFMRWRHSENITGIQANRDDDYKAQKGDFAAQLLEKTFSRFPELKDAIIASSVATPLTFRDYTGTPGGSLYGPLKDVDRPAQTALAVRTKIPNLLLTGQNVNMHGVMGVTITAVATCAELLGLEYLLSKIRSA